MVISRYLSTWGLHFLGIISLCLLLIITTRLLIPSQRLWQDRLFLKLPIIGPLCKMKELTYFLHFFSVGANTKLPLLDNLHLSAQPVKNIWIKHCLFKLKEKVQNGESISQAFRTINLFDQTTVRLIQVGEVSGHLTSTLETLQEYQTHSLKRQINKILSLVQPCLLGLVGLILIWIVLGVFYPLYDQLITLEGQI